MAILGSGLNNNQNKSSNSNLQNVVVLSHFNGTNGSTNITDVMGHTINAVNGAALSTSNPKFGTAAVSFDGINDYIEIVSNGADEFKFLHNGSDWTIEFWLWANVLVQEQVLFDTSGYRSGNVGIAIALQTNGEILVYTSRAIGANPSLNLISSGSTVEINSWNYIAINCNSGLVKTYINAIKKAEGSMNNPSNANPTFSNPWIATWHNNNGITGFLNGKIDELRISDIARAISTTPTQEF